MYLAAHLALLLAMLASLLGGALACMEAWHGQRHKLPWLERCQARPAFQAMWTARQAEPA